MACSVACGGVAAPPVATAGATVPSSSPSGTPASVTTSTDRGDAASDGDHVSTALDTLNRFRTAAGLRPVTLDDAMSRACALHARYLTLNASRPELSGLGVHHENPALPGYTVEGQRAGERSNISPTPLPVAVGRWMNTLYHRTSMLQPGLERVGMASVGGNSLLMFEEQASDPASFPVRYPADGMDEVPTAFGRELPNPLPPNAGPAGYAITAMWHRRARIVGARGRLEDADGAPVPAYFSSPEQPASTWPQEAVVALIPREPLRPSARYTVTIEADVDGAHAALRWSFTTVAAETVDAADGAAVVASVGRLVRIVGEVRGGGESGGQTFLNLGRTELGTLFVILPSRLAAPLASAGFADPRSLVGRRVEVLGIPVQLGRAINVEPAVVEDLRLLPP